MAAEKEYLKVTEEEVRHAVEYALTSARCFGWKDDQIVRHVVTGLVDRSGIPEWDEAMAKLEKVAALAENWRHKGEFGWGPWQLGEGPDPEGQILDEAATELRNILSGTCDS